MQAAPWAVSSQVPSWALVPCSQVLLLLTLLHLNAGCSVKFIEQSADLYGSHLWLSQIGMLCRNLYCLSIVQAALWAVSSQGKVFIPCSQVLLLLFG